MTVDLSIVVCARNEERYLPAQLAAIHAQGCLPAEVVLVDDGSTDSTLRIMQSFQRMTRCMTVRVIPLHQNIGAIAAYNLAVYRSTSRYVYCASANDVIQHGAMAAIHQALQMWPSAPIITGDLDGLPLGWAESPTHIGGEQFGRLLGWPNIAHGAACVVSRQAWDWVGGWQDDVGAYADALMWPILAARHGIVYTPHPIAWVRPGEGQNYGAMALDPERRRPYLEAFARHILNLEEPTRSRLLGSHLWDIREFAPEMREILSAEMAVAR